jgi:hypothetical protein
LKLQKRVNRRVGEKEYLKWYVNLPEAKIKELKWKDDQDLDVEVKGNKVILKPKKD